MEKITPNQRRIFVVTGTKCGHYEPDPNYDSAKPITRLTHCLQCKKELIVPDLPSSNAYYCKEFNLIGAAMSSQAKEVKYVRFCCKYSP